MVAKFGCFMAWIEESYVKYSPVRILIIVEESHSHEFFKLIFGIETFVC